MDKFTAHYFCIMMLNYHSKNTNSSSTSSNKVLNYWLMFMYCKQAAAFLRTFPIWFPFRQNVVQILSISNYHVSALVYSIHKSDTICCARALVSTQCAHSTMLIRWWHKVNPQQHIYRPFGCGWEKYREWQERRRKNRLHRCPSFSQIRCGINFFP